MFSKTTEYALRAAVFLSDSGHRNATSHEIAEFTKVPVRYMSKVLQTLAQAGVVTSQRGPTGGFALSREPGAITMLDVVQAVEPIQRVHECPLDLGEHDVHLCPLHQKMDDLAAEVERRLAQTSLASLLDSPLVPLGFTRSSPPKDGNRRDVNDSKKTDNSPTELD